MQSETTPYRPSPPPLDAEGFVKSFSLGDLDGAAASFDELGFVVIDGVQKRTSTARNCNDVRPVSPHGRAYTGGLLLSLFSCCVIAAVRVLKSAAAYVYGGRYVAAAARLDRCAGEELQTTCACSTPTL